MDEFLKYKIADIGSFHISVYNIFIAVIILIVSWIILMVIKRIIYRFDKFDDGKKYALYRLTKYFLMVITIVLILSAFGVDITVFIAGSAALLVGIGLGVQSLFNDFISGIELLIEGSLKVNDIIEVDGIVARVKKIGLRTSEVLTADGIYIIIPNSFLTSNKLINWTHAKNESRFHLQLGISYKSDVNKAMKIMIDAAVNNEMVIKEPKPHVRLLDFGDSAVILDLLFWLSFAFNTEDIKSDIRKEIYKKFGENNIEIPFPQRTVHLNPVDLKKKTKK